MNNKYKFLIKGKYDDNFNIEVDKVASKGSVGVLITSAFIHITDMAIECEISKKELLDMLKQIYEANMADRANKED